MNKLQFAYQTIAKLEAKIKELEAAQWREKTPVKPVAKDVKTAEEVLEATLDSEQSIESIVEAMHRFHAQFATEAGGDVEALAMEYCVKEHAKDDDNDFHRHIQTYYAAVAPHFIAGYKARPNNSVDVEDVIKVVTAVLKPNSYELQTIIKSLSK